MKGKTVLIVDDDAALCDNLRDILQDDGYELISATTCAAGLQLALEQKPRVALLDLKLPDCWGTAMLSELGRRAPDCVAIIMTAYADVDSALTALENGVFHFLRKPVRMEELLHSLERAFEMVELHEEKLLAEETLKRKNAELQEINDRLKLIVKSAKAMTACARIEEFGPVFLKEFARNMAASGGSLFLKRDNELVLIHSLDPGHVPESIALPLNEGSVFHRAFTSGEPVYIQNVEFESGLEPSGWRGYSDGSLLVFPLTDETGETIGIVSLHNKTMPPFTAQDREIGSILVSYSCEAVRAMRALNALRESEEQFRSLGENAPDIIYTLKTDGSIAYVNPAWEKILGFDRREVTGKPFASFIREESGGFARLLRRITDDGETVRDAVVLIQCNNGGDRVFSMSGAPKLDAQGNITGIVGICKDITEQRKLQAQLQHAQKMKAVGTLAGGIAHDLNNILQAISGYVQLLLIRKQPEDQDWNFLGLIDKSVQRAADLIQRLLIFSRRVESKKEPLDLNRQIENARKLLERIVPRMIRIEVRSAADLRPIDADPVQIEQILVNLCINARDAMPDNGCLAIETRNVHVAESSGKHMDVETGDYVLLTVSDTGHGMDEHTLKQIYEPFFTTKEIGKGTGLGLSMVYGIVKNHDGYITCHSEVGRGTTFNIYFPALKGEHTMQLAEIAGNEVQAGKWTILLVDDEEPILTVGSIILAEFGYRTLTADSGEKALDIIRKSGSTVDLVILDLNMPGMGGLRCFHELRTLQPRLKVIVATGYMTDEDIRDSLETGVSSVLPKPYRLEDMLKQVKTVLEGAP